MYWPSTLNGVGSMKSGTKRCWPNGFMSMVNGLRGTHIATGYPVDVPLTAKEMQLATVKGPYINECWELMCLSVASRADDSTFIDHIEGNMNIDFIVENGVETVFH